MGMLTVTSTVTMELEGEHQSMLTMEIVVNTTITLSKFIAKLSIACSTIASSEEISGSKNARLKVDKLRCQEWTQVGVMFTIMITCMVTLSATEEKTSTMPLATS